MKKTTFCIILLSLFINALYVFGMDFSFSSGDLGLNAKISRDGDNIRIKYKMSNVNAISSSEKVTDDQKAVLDNISSANFEILASCSEPKMKIITMDLYGLDQSKAARVENTDWISITDEDDIAKLKELCSEY